MVAASYTHSKSFASLKGITEQLKKNLTTSQYLQIYDEYLDKAIIPIIAGTSFFDTFITSLLGWQERNFRRKVSFLHRSEIPSLIVSFLLQPTAELRVEAYKKLQLDRGIRIEFVRVFQERLEPYLKACNCELKNPATNQVELSYCLRAKQALEEHMRAKFPLLAIHLESDFWLTKALDFKQIIFEKYIRLTLTNAQRDYVQYFNKMVDLDTILQTYLIVTSRAIDKCDSRQGALTSHIQTWFKTGRSRVRSQNLSDTQSLETVNWEDLEDAEYTSSQEKAIEEAERQDLVRMLSKIADPTGAARAYLGIEEILKESEHQQLLQCSALPVGKLGNRSSTSPYH